MQLIDLPFMHNTRVILCRCMCYSQVFAKRIFSEINEFHKVKHFTMSTENWNESIEFNVGDYVLLTGKEGYIRYIGEVNLTQTHYI